MDGKSKKITLDSQKACQKLPLWENLGYPIYSAQLSCIYGEQAEGKMDETLVEFPASPAFKEAYDRLVAAIEHLERVQGSQVMAIVRSDEGFIVSLGFSKEEFEAFQFTSGLKPRN